MRVLANKTRQCIVRQPINEVLQHISSQGATRQLEHPGTNIPSAVPTAKANKVNTALSTVQASKNKRQIKF